VKNRSRPAGVVIPTLIYDDVPVAVEWLCRVFGFSARIVAGTTHAQLACGEGGGVMLGSARVERRTVEGAEGAEGAARVFEPPGAGPIGQVLLVVVDDVDAHCRHAMAAGATIEAPPATFPYGERQYTASDFAGHRWTFSQSVEDVDPAAWGAQIC
jgi:uncharacterized glyoxalase superfamily protein PhnB